MKKSKVSSETRDRNIKDADLGVAGWALRSTKTVAEFRAKKKAGKVPTGRIAYRAGQAAISLVIFLFLKVVTGMPFNVLSGALLVILLVGSLFGAARFALFSIAFWAVVGTITGVVFGIWPYSPSWWHQAAAGWAGGGDVPWTFVGGGILAVVIWMATGRLASKALGKVGLEQLEEWTYRRSKVVQDQRSEEEKDEYDKVGVTRGEVDELARRTESDRRRSIVFGGGTVRRKEPSEAREGTVSLSKEEPSQGEIAERLADLSGKIEEGDADVLARLVSSPDDGFSLGAPKPAEPASRSNEPILETAPASTVPVVGADADEDYFPGPSNAVAETQAETPVTAVTTVREISTQIEQPVSAVSASKINPDASRGRRRMSREDLGKMIDLFNAMSREDNLDLFVNATKLKLTRLTDEDYEELQALEGGKVLIALSQELKTLDQSRGRTATSERQKKADEFMTGGSSTMTETEGKGASPTSLADTLNMVRGAAGGRAMLGQGSPSAPPPPPTAEAEDFESPESARPVVDPVAVAPAPAPSPSPAPATEPAKVDTDDSSSHEILAVTTSGETVSFDVDPSNNGSTDPTMRRYPTQYASERVSVLNSPALSDDQKVDRLRTLDRAQNVSTLDLFASDEFASMLNLPGKVLESLRKSVVALLGQKPSDMDALQALFDRRVELVQKDLFDRPYDYQRITGAFMMAGADLTDLARRIDTPLAREVLDHSSRLEAWFEQNIAGVRSQGLKSALPLPPRGPGVLDRFSGTVDAALRGAGGGFPGAKVVVQTDPATPHSSVPASEQVIEMAVVEAPRAEVVAPEPVTAPAAPESARVFVKGVDPQWVSDAVQGSDAYAAEMADHFQMLVANNARRDEDRRREEREANEKTEREETQRKERERLENEDRERQDKENDRVRRETEFMASLPKSDALPFVRSLPTRFMIDTILSGTAAIIDGNVIANRVMRESIKSKEAFLADWNTRTGGNPDKVDELLAPGERLQAEIAVRNGELASRIVSNVAEACGLPADAGRDEIAARLADAEEQTFLAAVERVIKRGQERKELLETADLRRESIVAATVRKDLERQMGRVQNGEDSSSVKVLALQQDLDTAKTVTETLRSEATEAAEKIAAAEAEAQSHKAEAEAALKTAGLLEARLRELEERIASGAAPVEEEAAPERPQSEIDAEAIAELLGRRLTRFETKTGFGVYIRQTDAGFLVVADVPDEIILADEVEIGGRMRKLHDAIRSFILFPVQAVDPDLEVHRLLIIVNANPSANIEDETLGLKPDVLDFVDRSPVGVSNALDALDVEA